MSNTKNLRRELNSFIRTIQNNRLSVIMKGKRISVENREVVIHVIINKIKEKIENIKSIDDIMSKDELENRETYNDLKRTYGEKKAKEMYLKIVKGILEEQVNNLFNDNDAEVEVIKFSSKHGGEYVFSFRPTGDYLPFKYTIKAMRVNVGYELSVDMQM